MNGSYFPNPTFPSAESPLPETTNYTNNIKEIPRPGIDYVPMEQSYIENILRLNKGANVKIYVSFSDSASWKDKIFEGTLEEAGRDHIVISMEDGRWFLIPMIYLDYVEFDKKINYRPIDLNKKNAV